MLTIRSISSAAENPEQIKQQVDEVEIKRQSSDNGNFPGDLSPVTFGFHAKTFDILNVIRRQTCENQNPCISADPIKRGTVQEDIHNRCNDQPDQRHQEDRSHLGKIQFGNGSDAIKLKLEHYSDPLKIRAVVLQSDDGTKAALVGIDNISTGEKFRRKLDELLPDISLIVSASHTHYGGCLTDEVPGIENASPVIRDLVVNPPYPSSAVTERKRQADWMKFRLAKSRSDTTGSPT